MDDQVSAPIAVGPRKRESFWAPAVVAVVAAVLSVAAPIGGLVVASLILVGGALVSLPLRAVLPAMVFLVPVRVFVKVPLVGGELSEAGIVTFSLAAVLCIQRLLRDRVALTRWEWIIVLWWCWLVVSCAWSADLRASLHGLYQWTLLFAAILITVEYFSSAPPPAQAARGLVIGVLALVAFWSTIGFVQAAVGLGPILAFLKSPAAATLFPPGLLEYKLVAMDFNWRSGYDVRPFGPFINSTEFGAFTAVGLGIALFVTVSRSRLAPRWLAVVTAVLALSANVAALKATGWAAALAVLLVVFIAAGGSIRRALVYGVLTVGAVALLVVTFREPLTDRFRTLVLREGATGGAVELISRASVWSHYGRVALERPVTGSGLFTANSQGPVHWTALGTTGVTVANRLPTENGYLTTAIETGFAGLAALLLVVGGGVLIGLRLARRAPGDAVAQAAGVAAVGITALLVGNLATDDFAQETNQFLMGVLLGVIIVARRALAERRDSAA